MSTVPLAGPVSDDLAAMLPGTWHLRATNFPNWMYGERRSPTLTYELLSRDPLRFGNDVSWITADGEDKHILGIDHGRSDDLGLVWHGTGIMSLFRTRWSVSGSSELGEIVVLRIFKSLLTPAGIHVIVRDGERIDELRSVIARESVRFGLSAEDFASLTWLDAGQS